MQSQLEQLKTQTLLAVKAVKDKLQLEELENKILGRKGGELTNLMKGLKDLGDGVKKTVGQLANTIKIEIEASLASKRRELQTADWSVAMEKERLDITQPSLPPQERGHFHPNTIIQKDLEDLFSTMGFMVLDGPELESDYYNFTALNISANHPARDSQDTFYIKGHSNWVMRTHTSPVQVRGPQKYGVPIRAIVPGKCYRNEATDVRHEHTFYQLDGIVIDKGINLSHMKGVLEAVAKHLYGPETKVRMRPKYYPFVEPGVGVDGLCIFCKGKGCKVCGGIGWLELAGAGMIHPKVLQAGGIDPNEYSGIAWGFGPARMAMIKYGIEDIRLFNSGDLSFLEKF